MWEQPIEYADVLVVPRHPVSKQIWNGTEFVPMMLYRHSGIPNAEQTVWLTKTYGHRGSGTGGFYWDYSPSGNYMVMDEKVYMWYRMKWNKS